MPTRYIVDLIPKGVEDLVQIVPSAVSRKYPTALLTTKGVHLIVTLLFANSWTEDAQEFFTRLQVIGMLRSWTKYVEPKSFVQVFDRSNEHLKEE